MGTGKGERETGNRKQKMRNRERERESGNECTVAMRLRIRHGGQSASLILQFDFIICFSDLFPAELSFAETDSNNLYKERTVDWIH